jgi:arylsulfatase
LVSNHQGNWELYNLLEDRTELADLSEKKPQRAEQLESQWKKWAEFAGVREWPIKKTRATTK